MGNKFLILYSAIMQQGNISANSLSPFIGGEIFGEFGFKSYDTKLIRKYW